MSGTEQLFRHMCACRSAHDADTSLCMKFMTMPSWLTRVMRSAHSASLRKWVVRVTAGATHNVVVTPCCVSASSHAHRGGEVAGSAFP